MMPIVGAKPPACWKGWAPCWWRLRMHSISVSRISRDELGVGAVDDELHALLVNGSSTAWTRSSSASRPSRRAFSAIADELRWPRPVDRAAD